jgi:hypothetical protein
MAPFLVLLGLAALWATSGPNVREIHEEFAWRPVRGLALASAFGVCVAILASGHASPFLYFQF